MNFTIRPNTAGAGWEAMTHRDRIPPILARVRATGRPVLCDEQTAIEADAWLKDAGWEPHDAPVFLERFE